MNELALFAGAGGGILGGHLLGWRTVCAVEWEPYPASVLCARQNDGILPPFPIWDDVCTFDGKPWRGIVDVVSGGFPCQDISSAGGGAGITGSRSGLWKEMARIIREVRPQYAFIENSPMLTLRGLDTVLCDLASMGFDANWGVVSAADVGAPHLRERIWILAHAMRGSRSTKPWEQQGQRPEIVDRGGERNVAHSIVTDAKSNGRFQGDANSSRSSQGMEPRTKQGFGNGCGFVAHSNSDSRSTGAINAEQVCKTDMAYTDSAQCQGNECAEREQPAHTDVSGGGWWSSEPNVGRVANGVASRVDRLKAIGNGQVPAVAAAAFQLLSEGL